jgi:hypothetical protein
MTKKEIIFYSDKILIFSYHQGIAVTVIEIPCNTSMGLAAEIIEILFMVLINNSSR